MSNQYFSTRSKGAFLLFIGFVLLILSFYMDDNILAVFEPRSKREKEVRKPVDLINEHLLKSFDKVTFDSLNIVNQNKMSAFSLKDLPVEVSLSEEEISAFYGGINYEEIVKKKINEENFYQDKLQTNLEQSEIERAADEKKRDEQRKYREKYSKMFLEMTKKEGYQVELDEDFNVRSAKKIMEQKKMPNYNSGQTDFKSFKAD